MSAFLYYSQEHRPHVRDQYPDMKNAGVSITLASRWKVASLSERQLHIDKERVSRELYYEEHAAWKISEQERVNQERSSFLPVNVPILDIPSVAAGGLEVSDNVFEEKPITSTVLYL